VANQVIPRLTGDEYQHLYSWRHVLSLLRRRDLVRRVRVEDQDGGSVDDVTVHHEPHSDRPDEFFSYYYQVKYHEKKEHHYTTDLLMEKTTANGRSLLQKFFFTWKALQGKHPDRSVRLYLVSNWSWNQDTDKLGSCLSNQHDRLTEEFFTAGLRSEVGRARERWREHVGADPKQFAEFARCLHFELGEGSFRLLRESTAERMENLGLKSDDNALAVAVDIVRSWIRNKQADITIDVLERVLKERELYRPESSEQCVTVYLNTIAEKLFDLEPDFVLDWRKYFEGRADQKGHQLKNPANWNKKLLPELRNVAEDVRRTTTCQLIRARGLARLSAWFAFGYTFSEVAGYVIEVQQQDEHWRSDAPPADDFRVAVSGSGDPNGNEVSAHSTTVACGISVTGMLDDDVRKHVQESKDVRALLLLRPERELGRGCLRSAADAVALARRSKDAMRGFVKHWGATKLRLYYFGPLSGACFIGNQLNAVCRNIEVMEDQQPGYSASFLLG
jgi:hypothetical protein